MDNGDNFSKMSELLTDLGKAAFQANEKKIEKPKRVVKPKILKINTKESIIEGNLVEMPFISYHKRKEPIMVIEYIWTDRDGKKHGIEVRGSKHGVPTSYDFDVLIAILRIYVLNSNIIYDQHIENVAMIDDNDVIINFSIAEIAREMGYKSISKKCV